MAEVAVDERRLLKTMRWWDGFIIGLANPGFLLVGLGFSVGCPRRQGRRHPLVRLRARRRAAGVRLRRAGGDVPRQARRPLRLRARGLAQVLLARRARSPSSATGSPGRACSPSTAASSAPSSSASSSPTSTRTACNTNDFGSWTFDLGPVRRQLRPDHRDRRILACYIFNIRGMRPAVWFSYVTGAMMVIPVLVLAVGPFLTGDFNNHSVGLNNVAETDHRHLRRRGHDASTSSG